MLDYDCNNNNIYNNKENINNDNDNYNEILLMKINNYSCYKKY